MDNSPFLCIYTQRLVPGAACKVQPASITNKEHPLYLMTFYSSGDQNRSNVSSADFLKQNHVFISFPS